MATNTGLEYRGTSKWRNEETGEIRMFDEFEKPVGRTERFMITYLCEIIKFIDVLGNRKMKVVRYILKNMQKSNNTLLITQEELAKKVGVSRKTVSETIKILVDAELLKKRNGAIMVNPRLMNNKKVWGEAHMMIKFTGFNKKET